MSAYSPLHISGNQTGLVQNRQEFILPNDAYPRLENAFLFREQIRRKQGYELLGRLRRVFTTVSIGNSGASPWTFNILAAAGVAGIITGITNANPGSVTTNEPHNLVTGTTVTISEVVGMTQVNGVTFTITSTGANSFTLGVDTSAFGVYASGGVWKSSVQPNAQLEPGSVIIVMGGVTFSEPTPAAGVPYNGTLTSVTIGNTGVINYQTGVITLTTTVAGATPATASFNYFPSLPVMGLRNRDLNSINNQTTIAFDTVYAYTFSGTGWQEFIPGTTWTGNDSDFFWHTNYWQSAAFLKLFWVTNFSGGVTTGDPIRYTDGVTWTNFSPVINSVSGDVLNKCLCILPFRGQLLVFNTWEGPVASPWVNYPQRIRWAFLGSPLTADAWYDNVRGKGGFIDIPTNEVIVSVGNVRDNLVIYCSRSTWQLRYTGRSINPFQIEKVNSELGAESTFSTVQFDTSLVGIGDKGIVECDSFKSNRIDIKIPDLVFQFNDGNNGTKRIQGIRDFVQRLAYWTYPYQLGTPYEITFPNRRLVYNYENDSWAIFTDALTALGTFLPLSGRTWANTPIPWNQSNFAWSNRPQLIPDIIGGNQQGFVEWLDSKVTNDVSLYITAIVGDGVNATVVTSPNHNLVEDTVIQISGITASGYSSLNGGIFGISPGDNAGANKDTKFTLYTYNAVSQDFTTPQVNALQTYNGGGQIAVRDGFYIQSKKFNFVDQGESIQMGYMDILMDSTEEGAITLNTFINYNDDAPVNVKPQNEDDDTTQPDTFFNSVVSTSNPNTDGLVGNKYWQRVYCPVRGNFITIVWTLSNEQLTNVCQESDVQIDAQILWQRPAGRMTNQ